MNFDLEKKYSINEIKQMDIELDFYNLKYLDEVNLLSKLDELFKLQNNIFLFDHRYDYTRWWTVLSWKKMNSLSEEEIINLFSKQIPEAILFGIDVWQDLMWYFNKFIFTDVEKILSMYGKIKKTLWNSKSIIGKNSKGEFLYLSDVIKEIEYNEKIKKDNLEIAEFYLKIENAFFSKNKKIFNEHYVFLDKNEVVSNLVDIINFFIGIDERSIFYIVDIFANEQIINKEEQKKIEKNINVEKQILEVAISEKKENDLNVKIVEKDKANLKKEIKKDEPKKIDYNLIRMDIEMNFDIDDEANFIDLEGVLNKLEELKNKYSDDKILELYYFDEKENRFIWNDKLLNS
jgi:hypothetical protein